MTSKEWRSNFLLIYFLRPIFSRPIFSRPIFSRPIFSRPIFSRPIFSRPMSLLESKYEYPSALCSILLFSITPFYTLLQNRLETLRWSPITSSLRYMTIKHSKTFQRRLHVCRPPSHQNRATDSECCGLVSSFSRTTGYRRMAAGFFRYKRNDRRYMLVASSKHREMATSARMVCPTSKIQRNCLMRFPDCLKRDDDN
jgi:hypothetical protein